LEAHLNPIRRGTRVAGTSFNSVPHLVVYEIVREKVAGGVQGVGRDKNGVAIAGVAGEILLVKDFPVVVRC
jgi:hypothetical protein